MFGLTRGAFALLLIAACMRRYRAKAMWQLEKRQAERLRDMLIRVLGGVCAKCGTTKYLSIDHIDGRNWQPRDFAWVKRIKRYVAEWQQGVRLRVLCLPCNGRFVPFSQRVLERKRHAWRRRHWQPKQRPLLKGA